MYNIFMSQKDDFRNSASIRSHIIEFFIIVFAVLQIMKKYELICKRRNYHEPKNNDLNIFFDDDSVIVNTECIDCGCALKLFSDGEDSNIYWIQET